MDQFATRPGTGLPSLDHVLQGLMPGDNVVWQVDSVEDYQPFVEAYCEGALRKERKLVYFRFAHHAELVPPRPGLEIHHLDPQVGFESFTTEIHRVIETSGRGVFYVFDCLSDLASDWYSDLMLGNFFMVTCPYLYELETVTYFALLRHRHSFHAVASIRDTTQLLLDVHRHDGRLYVHPLKVWQRYSPTMYLPHVWESDDFRPVTESAVISDIYSALTGQQVDTATRTLDLWDRTFLEAQEMLQEIERGDHQPEEANIIFSRLLRMVVSHDERILSLAAKYLTLADLLAIRRRMLGTGLIGGKSVGMLLARAILRKAGKRWPEVLEAHDSFYIGSDVFYTYLVTNGCWRVKQRLRQATDVLEDNDIEEARQRMLTGVFPEFLRNQFAEILDYFGQSPVVVRSSSLLEDSFGTAFAGKYESIFCVNQGTPQERLESFLSAVRNVYASSLSAEALRYRARRNLLGRDEQMALLVQRVSGAVHGHMFFPHVAGVGLSFNPYAWSEHVDPEAGMLRLVFGLGTRAVYRHDEDYTRIVALNAPHRRPETSLTEVRQYAQHRVDVLDLKQNRLVSRHFAEVAGGAPDLPLEHFATCDPELAQQTRGTNVGQVFPWVLTFDHILSDTPFVQDMREMLQCLEKAYDYPVDIEFTANFPKEGGHRINLVQCRPLQVSGGGVIVAPPPDISPQDVIFASRGAVIGRSLMTRVERLVYVVPTEYVRLPVNERYSVARLVGRITRLADYAEKTLMLLGPGRWGTTTPSLGVPVSFAEIDSVSVLGEIVDTREAIVPDVSLGTHFFNDIVESGMLYLAIFPAQEGNFLNESFFQSACNRLADLLPEDARWAEVVYVIDACDIPQGGTINLNANAVQQRALCYLTYNTRAPS